MNNENRTHPAPVLVEPTEELVARLFDAQLAHTKATIESYTLYPGSDDGRDYLNAALELAAVMSDIQMDNDLGAMSMLLNTPNHIAMNFACDGVANEFYELNCHALPADLDFYEDDPA